MRNTIMILLLVTLGVLPAHSADPVIPSRPDWMPVAPALPVVGRTVQVRTVAELTSALENARDGDTILLADGVYRIPHVLTLAGRSNVQIRGASMDPSKVVVRGLSFEKVNSGDDILRIQGCTNVTVAYLTFAEAHAYGVKLENLRYQGRGLENIQIYRCNFSNIGTRAIKGTSGDGQPVQSGSIRYCSFENTKIPSRQWIFEGDYISAIDCMLLKDWVISDNYFKNIRGANGGGRGAVFIWVESQNVITERNVFVGCDRSICYGNPSGSTAEPTRPHNSRGIIRNNFIVGGVDTGIEVCWADGVGVFHNTVLMPDARNGIGIHYHWKTLTNIRIANNLVRGTIFGEEGGIQKWNNLTEGVADDWFKDMPAGDLHLTRAALPAIDKTSLLPECPTDWDGQQRPTQPGQVDLGADEFKSR